MDGLKKFEYTMDSCNHCGQCKWILPPKMKQWDFAEICPIHQRFNFDAYSGQGLINIAKEVMKGTLQYGDGLEEMIYTCTCCGACDINCKNVRDMDVLDTIYALREDCVSAGKLPEAHKETAKKIAETHNIYGKPHADRFAWLPADYADDADADTALFIGCAAAYEQQEIALAAIKILKVGGVKFKLLREDEWCCGTALWRTGQHDAAEALVKRNIETFARHGIKTVITACGECFGSFRNYPRFAETPFEVRHISEVAAELIASGKLQPKKTAKLGTVTYHDPCMLGRLSEKYVPWDGQVLPYGRTEPRKVWRRGEKGVYEAPRAVLRALVETEPVEMTRNLEDSYCCGAGGGAPAINPEFAAWTADERRREAKASGADTVVSCCPFCRDALGDDALPCVDLAVLLADAL